MSGFTGVTSDMAARKQTFLYECDGDEYVCFQRGNDVEGRGETAIDATIDYARQLRQRQQAEVASDD